MLTLEEIDELADPPLPLPLDAVPLESPQLLRSTTPLADLTAEISDALAALDPFSWVRQPR